MAEIDNSDQQRGQLSLPGNLADRRYGAKFLPFGLRAWWLRNYDQSVGLTFGMNEGLTAPADSFFSDPLCDAANMDSSPG